MAIYQARPQRLRFWQESSFGTDGSGTLGNYSDIPAVVDTIEPVRAEPIAQPGHLIQRLDQRDPGVPMPRTETRMKFTTNLETVSTKATNGVTITQHWLGLMLECGLGGKYLGTGTTISGTSSTTTVVNVASAAGMRAGGALGIVNASTGRLEIREIKSIATNAITLKMALGAAPTTAGVTVYGCATYFLHNHPNGTAPIYGQFLLEGYHPKDRWMLPGGAFESFGFSGLEPSGIPRLEWSWQFPCWQPADGTNTVANLRDTALGRATYTNVVLNTVRDADVRLRPLSASTLPGFMHAVTANIQPHIRYEALRTPGNVTTLVANSTCFGYARLDTFDESSVSTSLDAHWEDDTTLDGYHSALTEVGLYYQIGALASRGGVLISVPRNQIQNPPAEVTVGGMKGKRVELYALGPGTDDGAASAGATATDIALAESTFKLHFA